MVFCDKRNHASLIDACRLASAQGATVRYYHSLERLKSLTARWEETPYEGRLFIVSDTIYSMDGDLADLPRLARRATEIGAILILDDAHGTGLMGVHGGGAWEFWFGVLRGWELTPLREKYSPLPRPAKAYLPPVIHIGTLSKALGSQGGFVAGSREIIDWLINTARPFIYSTGLSPANCGAALQATKIVRRDFELRHKLRQNTERLANGLRELDYDAHLHLSPIIPIIIGNAERAVALSEALLQRGLWCPAIRPPTVPKGSSRLRLTANAAWDDETMSRILQVFAQVKNEF
jgi:7-keto-8-aminopelargonate synthetase-like enzyme